MTTIKGVAVTAESVRILLGAVKAARNALTDQYASAGHLTEKEQEAYDALMWALDAVLK